MAEFLYQQLEKTLREDIVSGQRAPGEKLPSIRSLCEQQSLSKSTVLAAYARLEAEGLVEAQSRSGYFVCGPKPGLKIPHLSQPEVSPKAIGDEQLLLDIMEQGAAFDVLPGSDEEPSNDWLRRCLSRAQRRQTSNQYLYYDEPKGLLELRQQIVSLMAHGGSTDLSADGVVITSGCQHALLLALMATTKAGDVVAVESPGFYGVFQLIEALGLQALELPCSSDTGLSPDGLALAIEHWDIKALLVTPCYATPTGASMPESSKQRLLSLCQANDIAIIEDDIYGELYFGLQRPRSLYSYDRCGNVLLCSSFSKNLSRDLRLGWIAPGKYMDAVSKLKLATSLASSRVTQQGLSQYLAEGGFDRHLRRKRQQYRSRCQQLLGLIQRHFPMAQSCSQPEGGLVVWLELPDTVDTVALYNQAKAEGIVLTPGRLFTAQERYRNFLRISFAHPWTDVRQQALSRLGTMIKTDN